VKQRLFLCGEINVDLRLKVSLTAKAETQHAINREKAPKFHTLSIYDEFREREKDGVGSAW